MTKIFNVKMPMKGKWVIHPRYILVQVLFAGDEREYYYLYDAMSKRVVYYLDKREAHNMFFSCFSYKKQDLRAASQSQRSYTNILVPTTPEIWKLNKEQ